MKLDLAGKIFGDLKVIRFESICYRKSYWRTLCLACNNEHVACGTDMKRGKISNCGCTKNKQSKNGQWKGHEGLWGKTLYHYKHSAKKRNITFKVSIKYLWDQYLKQDKKCPYTGIDLILESKNSISRTPSNSSLDRIDSTKGYIEGNVQWVFKKINLLKSDLSEKEFIELCTLVSKHSNSFKNETNKPGKI